MAFFGVGTETYLFVNGLKANQEIKLAENKVLMPVLCPFPFEIISKKIKNDIDFSIIVLNANSITSQLKIVADNPKDLAASAWNTQWDLILLSAIFNCPSVCNLQCSHSINAISDKSILEVTNYHLKGLFAEPYIITKEDTEWLEQYYLSAQSLLDMDSFTIATHSLATYKWHNLPRVQMAILWAGIEALFNISSELSFRTSLYVSKFLGNGRKETEKKIFEDTKNLYKIRSSAVHGSKIKGDAALPVEKSALLLNSLIKKCIELKSLPSIDELPF